MELFDFYLRYMTALSEGSLSPPEGIALAGETPEARMGELLTALRGMSVPEFVRRCADAAGDTLPEGLLENFDEDAFAREFFARMALTTPSPESPSPPETAENAPQAAENEPQTASDAPDPDAGKHAFEVFCDCLMLDEGLVSYLIEVLNTNDRTGFYRLSQITTKLDLDPDEFLYWLAHREDYAESDTERACAVIIDTLLERLREENRLDIAAALLAGDRMTFDAVRCEAPELRQLPIATFRWFEENYLDRDYPLRFLLRCNGVAFPETLKGEKK